MTTDLDRPAILDRIVSTLGDLPASPAIVSSVMNLTSNPDSQVREISRVLSTDPSLTAKVLKLSNSSFYGRSQGVSTLQSAIMLLGFATVRSIVVATSAHNIYTSEAPGEANRQLWEHSLATAVAARQLAHHLKLPGKDELFISALLHDIGKLVLLQKMPETYHEVISEVEGTNTTFVEVESKQLGFTHCQVSAVLLEQWKFPTDLQQAVLEHHQPSTPEEGKTSAAQLICLANYLAKQLGVGFSDGQQTTNLPPEVLQLLPANEEVRSGLRHEIKEYFETETRILEES